MHFRNRLRATPAEKQHIYENIDSQSRPSHKSRYAIPRSPVLDAWRQSRRADRSSEPLPAGSQRPVTLSNIFAAAVIVRSCMVDLFILLFNLHPTRTLLLVLFNILRGTLPSVRGYSQARILDEVITSHKWAESSSDRITPRRKICSRPTGRYASTRYSLHTHGAATAFVSAVSRSDMIFRDLAN